MNKGTLPVGKDEKCEQDEWALAYAMSDSWKTKVFVPVRTG